MNLEIISTLAEVVGSMGVIISLIYLARQIGLSNKLSHSETRFKMLESGLQEIYMCVDHPEILHAFTKETLSDDEKIKLVSWLEAHFRQREFDWFQMQHGIIDEQTFNSYAAVISIILATDRTRRWWDSFGMYYDPGFSAYVNDFMQKNPGYTEYWKNLKSWS